MIKMMSLLFIIGLFSISLVSADLTLGTSDQSGERESVVLTVPIPTESINATNVTYLDDLLDVNVPSPTDAYVLTWDDGTSMWIASPIGTGDLTSAVANQTYAGIEWDYNQTAPAISYTDDLNASYVKFWYNQTSVSGGDLTSAVANNTYLAYSGQIADFNVSGYKLTSVGELIMTGLMITEDIIPTGDSLYTLGNSSNWFKEAYLDLVHSENVTTDYLDSDIIDSGNITSDRLNSTEIENHKMTSEDVNISQNLTIAGYEFREEDNNLIVVLT